MTAPPDGSWTNVASWRSNLRFSSVTRPSARPRATTSSAGLSAQQRTAAPSPVKVCTWTGGGQVRIQEETCKKHPTARGRSHPNPTLRQSCGRGGGARQLARPEVPQLRLARVGADQNLIEIGGRVNHARGTESRPQVYLHWLLLQLGDGPYLREESVRMGHRMQNFRRIAADGRPNRARRRPSLPRLSKESPSGSMQTTAPVWPCHVATQCALRRQQKKRVTRKYIHSCHYGRWSEKGAHDLGMSEQGPAVAASDAAARNRRRRRAGGGWGTRRRNTLIVERDAANVKSSLAATAWILCSTCIIGQ